MRWLLVLAIACAEPESAPPPVERSPDEQIPVEPPSAIEASGGFTEAMFAEATRRRSSAPTEAAAMFGRACDHGHTPSCMALADMLERGDGIEANAERAAALYDQACFAGSTEACDHLGH